MKHTDMIPLMGKIVTVSSILYRTPKEKWVPLNCPPWVGWIVGFAYRQDGETECDFEEGTIFREISRQLCILVTSWPTKKPIPVPLDGYTMGGKPQRPDWGGWRAYRENKEEKIGQ